jgi:NAD-dependent deacetylase
MANTIDCWYLAIRMEKEQARPRKKIVILTGAGISAESGLKTFRDSDGLWEGYAIEDVATPRAWHKHPQLVLNFYNMRRKAVLEAQPNAAHHALVALEKWFDVFIVTQNVDDLHERAGSKKVLHLHGEILKMRSEANTSILYHISGDINIGDIAPDGHQLRPAIVWFEEPVPLIDEAATLVSLADIVVVIGTSLVVYPAAGLLYYAQPSTPVFVVDKKIPHVDGVHVHTIEMPATEGVPVLVEQLKLLA